MTPLQLLALRFSVAAAVMLCVAFLLGQKPWQLPARTLLSLLALGGGAYFASSLTFFLALKELPATLCELIQFVYPPLVVGETWLFFREAVPRTHMLALITAIGGVVLLIGGLSVRVDGALALAIVSPVAYSVYLLFGARLMTAAPRSIATSVILLGTAMSFIVTAGMTGQLQVPSTGTQWFLTGVVSLVAGVFGAPLLLAGLALIGARRSSVLGSWEPMVTAFTAAVVLGERLTPSQIGGAFMVLSAVVFLQLPRVGRQPR
jgi:drug/metabolite transporter (DMT)-like permease